MQSLGFLDNFLPFMAVLGLFRQFKELHLSQVIPDIVIPSVFRSSNWSSYIWLPFMYFLYNAGFRLSIYVSVPAQSLGFSLQYLAGGTEGDVGNLVECDLCPGQDLSQCFPHRSLQRFAARLAIMFRTDNLDELYRKQFLWPLLQNQCCCQACKPAATS